MAAPPWFPFYIGDYMRDTARLSTEEHGAYLLLILDYWANGSPPDDDKILATITKISTWKWKNSVRASLEKLFHVENGHWSHKRIEHELLKAQQLNGVKVLAGRLGAERRWGKSDSSSHGNSHSSAMAEASKQDAQPQPQSQSLDSSFGDVSKEDQGRRVLGDFDFLSSDGEVLIYAEEFDRLRVEMPAIRDIRALVRNACRSWLTETKPGYRKDTLLRWLRKKNTELADKQALITKATEVPLTRQTVMERGRERREQSARAEKFRQRRPGTGGTDEAKQAGELSDALQDGSDEAGDVPVS